MEPKHLPRLAIRLVPKRNTNSNPGSFSSTSKLTRASNYILKTLGPSWEAVGFSRRDRWMEIVYTGRGRVAVVASSPHSRGDP